jgi:hypothetical protein
VGLVAWALIPASCEKYRDSSASPQNDGVWGRDDDGFFHADVMELASLNAGGFSTPQDDKAVLLRSK